MPLAVLFHYDVQFYLEITVSLGLLLIEVVALVNCLSQRADAFPVVGSLSKAQWAGILLASVLLTAGCGLLFPGYPLRYLFIMIAITAAAIYMLDVRPALRDATNGSGGW